MRTASLVRPTVLLATALLGLSGCSTGGAYEKVATAVQTDQEDGPTTSADPSQSPTGAPDDDPTQGTTDAPDENARPAYDFSAPVEGTQVVDLSPVGQRLTLEIPDGWQPSTPVDVPYVAFVALDPEPVGEFSANIFITVEPLEPGTTPEDVFLLHRAGLLGYDSSMPDGIDSTIDGYPAHVLSGALVGPSGQDLAQSSTLVVVEGDDGAAVAVAIALTTHADDAEGRQTLAAILEDATID